MPAAPTTLGSVHGGPTIDVVLDPLRTVSTAVWVVQCASKTPNILDASLQYLVYKFMGHETSSPWWNSGFLTWPEDPKIALRWKHVPGQARAE